MELPVIDKEVILEELFEPRGVAAVVEPGERRIDARASDGFERGDSGFVLAIGRHGS